MRVTADDFSYRLSRRSVPVGRVRFVIANRGGVAHDFAIGRWKTRLIRPGATAAVTVQLPRRGRVAYRCTIPGHSALGMRGVLTVGRAPAAPATTATTSPSTTTTAAAALKLTKIGDFERPVFVTAPLSDPDRVYVVEQVGKIWEVVADAAPTLFLDITGHVVSANERGLLSMAFAPDYETSGRFYVDYTDGMGDGNVQVVEYRRSAGNPEAADPSSARVVLSIVKPWETHNAGMLQFGPDGYLYIAVGDGDPGVVHEPGAFAQTLDDLLGNILRIDPLHPSDDLPYSIPAKNPFAGRLDARGEIWDYGLRNPWRFWIDRVTGDMYIGDAGLEGAEEVDYVSGNSGGLNFGWPCFEGTTLFDSRRSCDGAISPVLEYDHSDNRCAVIGGVVVRDSRLPDLAGRYLFGDYCNGKIRSMLVVDGQATDVRDTGLVVGKLSSFGTDARGRTYAASTDGAVYRLDAP